MRRDRRRSIATSSRPRLRRAVAGACGHAISIARHRTRALLEAIDRGTGPLGRAQVFGIRVRDLTISKLERRGETLRLGAERAPRGGRSASRRKRCDDERPAHSAPSRPVAPFRTRPHLSSFLIPRSQCHSGTRLAVPSRFRTNGVALVIRHWYAVFARSFAQAWTRAVQDIRYALRSLAQARRLRARRASLTLAPRHRRPTPRCSAIVNAVLSGRFRSARRPSARPPHADFDEARQRRTSGLGPAELARLPLANGSVRVGRRHVSDQREPHGGRRPRADRGRAS